MTGGEVRFRGTKQGVTVVLDDRLEFAALKERLRQRLLAADTFFYGAEVTLNVGARDLDSEQRGELEEIVRGQPGVELVQVVNEYDRNVSPIRPDTVEEAVETYGQAEEDHTLLVRRTLRSGQVVRFSGNVVVLGDVNPGAEVIAAGDVVVVGALRGLVHAGATGNVRAIVAAFRLSPTQLRIDSLIARPPDGNGPTASNPELARVRNGHITIEPYQAVASVAAAEGG